MTSSSPRVDLSTPEAWLGLVVGETLGPVAWSMTLEEQRVRLDALEVEHLWYRRASPLGGPVFFPVLFADLYYRLMDLKYDWPLAVATRLEIESCRPASHEETFSGTLRVVDRYERRGGRYAVTSTSIRDRDGRVTCVLRNWTLLNPVDRYAAGASWASARYAPHAGGVPAPTPWVDSCQGASDRRTLVRRHPTLYRFRLYYGAGVRNHHTDAAEAASIGLPGPLAPGTFLAAYPFEAMTEIFGLDWLSMGCMRVTYLAPVWAGDEVTVVAGPQQTACQGAPVSPPAQHEQVTMALTLVTGSGRTVAAVEASRRRS